MENKMTADRILICPNCRKKVAYFVWKRPANTIINDTEITYDEYYGVCAECNQEIYIPYLEDRNEEEIENQYREKQGLIKRKDIEKILKWYDIEKRPFSKLIGLGELTITRYLDGQLPSKRYSDLLFEIMNNDDLMEAYIQENGTLISPTALNRVCRAIEERKKNIQCTSSAERIALYIVETKGAMTNSFLQRLLYYVKGLSGIFTEQSIIADNCEAGPEGPFFSKVYDKFQYYEKKDIEIELKKADVDSLLSAEEREITDYVVKTLWIYNERFLDDLIHHERPWREARKGLCDDVVNYSWMDDEVIKAYFIEQNEKYNLKTSKGFRSYIDHMCEMIYLSPDNI